MKSLSRNEIISLVNVDEMHLVIVDSKGEEVCEIQYFRRKANQLAFIFREQGKVKEMLKKFNVDVAR